jgi:tetratricopeptide (TPR) repeat protein
VADATVVNTDDNLAVELTSPWLLYGESQTVYANWALFQPFSQAVVPLLVALGEHLDAERLGALALAYADERGDAGVVDTLVRLADSLGPSARALTARALVGARGQVNAEVLGALDQAVMLAPNAFEPHYFRCALRFGAGLDAAALEDADAALALVPDDSRSRVLRWRILQRLGRSEEAEPDLDATAASPFMATEPDLWPIAAEVYLARGRIDDAIAWLRRALEGHPNSVELWDRLATVYEQNGRGTDAAVARRNQSRARRNSIVLLQRDGRMAAWRGEWPQARAYFQQALAQDPSYGPVREDLARAEAAERSGH